jgi:hypothetical protein
MIDPEPPTGRGRGPVIIPAIVAIAVVLVGLGVTAWWFAAGPGHRVSPRPIAATGPSSAPQTRLPFRPSSVPPTRPDTSSAYDVGTCFDEQAGSGPGSVQLSPVACGSNRAVFVINKVVPAVTDCDADASVNYKQHGYEVPDKTANVAYCASLVVPVNACFTLGGQAAIAIAPCGSAPNVVQVQAIEPAPNVGAACTDKTNPDVWFYQAPTSGQYACVSRSTAAPTTTTTG